MRRSPLIVIFTTIFIDLVGFGIVIPVLPFYAEGTLFNATPRTRAYRKLTARLRDAQRAPAVRRPSLTFPTRLPALRLDHIFVSRSIEVTAAGTIRTPLARLASDHLPLVAELTVPFYAGKNDRRRKAGEATLGHSAM